jgi:hypothetical protein
MGASLSMRGFQVVGVCFLGVNGKSRESANHFIEAAPVLCGDDDGRAVAAVCVAAGRSAFLDECGWVSAVAARFGAGFFLSAAPGLWGAAALPELAVAVLAGAVCEAVLRGGCAACLAVGGGGPGGDTDAGQ